jgi:hypothetical protein
VALGVPGRLRPQIISTFGTTRAVGRQSNAPAAFTPGEIPGTHFQNLSRPQGTWFCRNKPRKKSQVTPPEINPGTVRLVAQRLNQYATPGHTKSDYVTVSDEMSMICNVEWLVMGVVLKHSSFLLNLLQHCNNLDHRQGL